MIKTVNRKDIEAFVYFVLQDILPDYETSAEADSFCVTCYFPDLKIGDPDFQSEYEEMKSRYEEFLDTLINTDYFSYSYTRDNPKGTSFAVKLIYSENIQVD